MGRTLDLGRRIELLPADRHCGSISIGLYARDFDGEPHVNVHTYSQSGGAADRVSFIVRALVEMGGLEENPDRAGWLRFPCNTSHERALRRGFLDLCKLESDAELVPRPMSVFDKKADADLTVVSLGDGAYRVEAGATSEMAERRARATAGGYQRLCEMEEVDGAEATVRFRCGSSHDELIGLLLVRAQNARAAMREEEMRAARGVLRAPSQQEA